MRNGSDSRFLVVLDCRNYEEIESHRDLSHPAGLLLKHLMGRLSIPPHRWYHAYVYSKTKQSIPKRKLERWYFLQDDITKLRNYIKETKPREIFAMGSLACEIFIGVSRVTAREGTCWKVRKEWFDLLERVYVSYSPDAALFNHGICVNITGVLAACARDVGIEIIPKQLGEVEPKFDWSDYL